MQRLYGDLNIIGNENVLETFQIAQIGKAPR